MGQRVKHVMNKYRKDGTYIQGSSRDLETYYSGLKYIEAKGLTDKGKRKNVYTETYSDSDKIRLWQGDDVTREATTIKMSFLFMGETRYQIYNDFYDYVKNDIIRYFDTKRLLQVDMVLIDKVTISNEQLKSGVPYFVADFTFQNLYGDTTKLETSPISEIN